MLERCQTAQERWGGVNQLVDRWLVERRQLIESFVTLKSSVTFTIAPEALEDFCQRLLDYVSAGHFGVYEQLNEEARAFGDRRGLDMAKNIYPRLKALTETALVFNDRCDNGDCRDSGILAAELTRLAQQLHERFELEDCLIEILHSSHQQPVLAIA